MFNTITFGNKEYLGRWISVDDELILAVDDSLKYEMSRCGSKIHVTFQKYLDMNIIQFVPGHILFESEKAISSYVAVENGVEKFA